MQASKPKAVLAREERAGRTSHIGRERLIGSTTVKRNSKTTDSFFVSSSSNDEHISIRKSLTDAQKNKQVVFRWHLGAIYAFFGAFDIFAHVCGLLLWRYRYETWALPRISDILREDIFTGIPTDKSDFVRLLITGSGSICRVLANGIVLWHAFTDLRPAWGLRLMRWITPMFRVWLVLYLFADLLQAFIPNIPPSDPQQVTTVHIFFNQMSFYAAGPTFFIILVVLCFDLDSGKPSVIAGLCTSILMTFAFIYYTTYLFKRNTGKATPMGWALATMISFLMINIGMAMPRRIVAMRGDVGARWIPKFLREGKVRVYEDTSARTGAKPLIMTGKQQKDDGLGEEEDAMLKRQKEELEALNNQFRSLFGNTLDSYDAPTEAELDVVSAGGTAQEPKAEAEDLESRSAQKPAADTESEPDF